MARVIISARGEIRDWSHLSERTVRELGKEMSLFQPVSVRIDKDDGTITEYIYLEGIESVFFTSDDEEIQ